MKKLNYWENWNLIWLMAWLQTVLIVDFRIERDEFWSVLYGNTLDEITDFLFGNTK